MPIVVEKYGSVGDTDRIRWVADRIVREREQGRDVVVVVSARGDATDDLLDKASDITPVPEPRELDMLLTADERMA
jgi:aspartate kinase